MILRGLLRRSWQDAENSWTYTAAMFARGGGQKTSVVYIAILTPSTFGYTKQLVQK